MNKCVFFLNLFLIFSFLKPEPILSQVTGKPLTINFSKDIYKGHSQNWSLTKTEDGILYVGNNKGLIRFDGSNWDIYSLPEQMVVRSVAVGPDNKVYVGTYEEFGYFSYDGKGNFLYTSLTDNLEEGFFHNDEIWRIIALKEKIYFQSFNSIFLYEKDTIKRIDPEGTIVLLLEADERIFIHKVNIGLFELMDDSLAFVKGTEVLGNDEIKLMFKLEENVFLLGAANSGLFLLEGEELKEWKIPEKEKIRNAEVNNGILLKDNIVIGTIVDGLFILDMKGNLIDHLNTSNFLQNNTVLSLYPEGKNSFWAGLDRGLDYVSLDNPIDIYIKPFGSTSSVFDAFYRDDFLYVATNQGVFLYSYNPLNGFGNPVLMEGSQGQVWDLNEIDKQLFCGHTNGTFRIEGQNMEWISEVNGGFEIKKIRWGNSEKLVQSTYSVFSVYNKVNGKWEYNNNVRGFFEPIPHFELDHLGNIWASHTNKGVYRLRPDVGFEEFLEVRYFGKEEGFHTNRKLLVAKVDNRIVFCSRKLIYTYDDLKESIIPYDFLNEGLGIFKASNRIIEAGNNHYWCVLENRIALFFIQAGSIKKLFDYDFASSGAWLSSNFPNVTNLGDSLHFICLDNGFAILDGSRSFKNESNLKAKIRKVQYKINKVETGSYIAPDEGLQYKFPFSQRDLIIEFSANEIVASRYFSYYLENLESGWSDWNSNSRVSYTRLPAGEYSFRLKAKTIDGGESEVSRFDFIIKKPWFFSNVAIALYLLFLIALIAFLRSSF